MDAGFESDFFCKSFRVASRSLIAVKLLKKKRRIYMVCIIIVIRMPMFSVHIAQVVRMTLIRLFFPPRRWS